MRLIDADALRASIEKDREESEMPKQWYFGIECAISHIIHAPTVDAVEVERPTGKWTMICNTVIWNQNGYITEWECDQCHEHQLITSKFCPNCGADMRGANDE